MIRKRSCQWLATLAVLAAVVVAAPAPADDERLPLWQIDGRDNRVYLLGSVHLLRESDYPIPAAIDGAYEDAETLVMELDMDDLDPGAVQALVRELGFAGDNGNLATLLGPDAYAEASRYAAQADIPLQRLAHTEPWFAAISVEQMMLVRVGYDPAFGIESHLAKRAADDGKEILGLETMRQQLELLDGLSADAQRSLLLQSLADSLEIGSIMDELVRAWRHGDTAYLEETVLQDMQAHPGLYRALVVERNRAWAQRIDALLAEQDDYLVVVGALHLVGDDGIPTMFRQRGRRVEQLRP